MTYKTYYRQIFYNVKPFCRKIVYIFCVSPERLIYVDLYEKIKMLTAEKKMSIRQLEEKLGFGNGTINRWRKNTPGVDKLEKVANYFNVSIDYLLDRVDWKSYDEKLTRENFESVNNEKGGLTVEDALKSVMSYDGKELTDNDRDILKGIIEGYLNSKDN